MRVQLQTREEMPWDCLAHPLLISSRLCYVKTEWGCGDEVHGLHAHQNRVLLGQLPLPPPALALDVHHDTGRLRTGQGGPQQPEHLESTESESNDNHTLSDTM